MAQKATSVYTSTALKNFTVLSSSALEKNPEIDHFEHLCKGMGAGRYAAGERNRGLETASATGTSISGNLPRLSRFLNRGSFLLRS